MTAEKMPREVTKPVWDVTPGLDFDPEVDLKVIPSWFIDATHSVPAWTPMFAWFWNKYCSHGLKYCANMLSLPSCKGWEWRTLHGHGYAGFVVVRDPEEIKRREVKFREALRPFIEDFDGVWKKYQDEIMAIYKPLREFDYDKATNAELLYKLWECIKMYARHWEIHFVGMYVSYNAWLLFEGLCKEQFNLTDQDPEFQKLLIGFDNKIYQNDRDLWQFAQDAMKAGLANIFLTSEPKAKEVIPKLEQTEAGRKFIKKLRDWLNVNGWRMQRMAEINEPCWVEDPSPVIFYIKSYIEKGGGFDLEGTRRKLAEEREKAVATFTKKVPAEQKEWFLALIRLAQKASSYSEEHNWYLDLYAHAMIRRCCLGIGRRLTQAGTIAKPEDIFFLNPDEVERVIMVPEIHDLRYIVNRRRKEYEEWQKEDLEGRTPPVITTRANIEEAVMTDIIPAMDAIAIKIVVGDLPKVRPELKADLYGITGSPGEAQGPARVVLSYEELPLVQPGDVLVAPCTYPSWTPVFSRINAVVIDRGGTLCHAAIIGREFGIPVVTNTFEATKKIRSGMKVRVNGTEGTVYILEK
ncbi:MAG: PEP-utilizing enzyme [Thermodesulfobacteriota bacterium]